MTLDYHVHPDFSPDASGSVADYCRRALELGIDELCFTTHWEPDPGRRGIERVIVSGEPVPVNSDWISSYLSCIDEARREFTGLRVRAGVEVGFEPGYEALIERELARHGFDFVLGAVHCIDHIAISAGRELDRVGSELLARGPGYLFSRYFENLEAAARSGLFQVLAHVDIYRKYVLPMLDGDFDDVIRGPMQEAIGVIAGAGVGIEVNTSALRRGLPEPFPDAAVLAMAYRAGVRTYTVGSDAHRPDQLGTGIARAIAMLRALGAAPARFAGRRLVS